MKPRKRRGVALCPHCGKPTKATYTYSSWDAMVRRCTVPTDAHYKEYGARGITVHPQWLGEYGFVNFFRDMGERPHGKTIDRKNGALGYSPENCRWATRREQARNRKCVKLTPALAAEIREASGTQKSIAAYYGVHQSIISRVRAGKKWAA